MAAYILGMVWRGIKFIQRKFLERYDRDEKLKLEIWECGACDSSILAQAESDIVTQNSDADDDELQKLVDRMVDDGWCYHQVRDLSQQFNKHTFRYLSSLERSSERLGKHRRCRQQASCVAYNTNSNSYLSRHTTPECVCAMVSTPYASLIEVIRSGKVPLISIEEIDSDVRNCRLKVHSRSKDTEYVAISHVWADGLGNPKTNALPLCQILDLRKNIAALESVLKFHKLNLFWIDTLCIPTASKDTPLKLLQIDKMASIYRGAACTLVLDQELMSITPDYDFVDSDAHFSIQVEGEAKAKRLGMNARAHIFCSAWMSRSWTFQEGWLSCLVAIQFYGQSVLFGRLSREYAATFTEHATIATSSPSDSARNMATTDVELISAPVHVLGPEELQQSVPMQAHWRDYLKIQHLPRKCDCIGIELQESLFEALFRGSANFTGVWNALARRSTTCQDDVPFMVTNVLNLNSMRLLECDEPSQMLETIILSQKKLPLSIFFLKGLSEGIGRGCKNRWIPPEVGPETLSDLPLVEVRPNHFMYEHCSSAEGQQVKVYAIEAAVLTNSDTFVFLDDEQRTYLLEFDKAEENQAGRDLSTSSCILVRTDQHYDQGYSRKGAFFYFSNKHKAKSNLGHKMLSWLKIKLCSLRKDKIPHLEITYNCAIRLRSVQQENPDTHPLCDPVKASLITDAYFKILYDSPPTFKPLTKRKRFIDVLDTWDYMVIVIICSVICTVAFFVAFRSSLGQIAVLILFLPLPMIGYLSLFLALFIGGILKKRNEWRYVQSFEAVATKRMQRAQVQV